VTEAEAGGLQTQDQSGLHMKFLASPGYMAQKKKKGGKKNPKTHLEKKIAEVLYASIIKD
jgi:hypothetical protein